MEIENGLPRGWLGWFSLGVWVTPVMYAYQFCTGAAAACTNLPSMLDSWLYTMVMLLFFFTPLAAMGVALVLWWRRARIFPVYWSALCVALLLLLGMGSNWLSGEGPLKDFTPRDLLQAVLVPAYWLKSRRVKATFTRKWRREGGGIPATPTSRAEPLGE